MGISGRYSEPDELPPLTPTAWTILGFLSIHPRNGYQLRQAVQRSVGHFWGVSYGQLYPQLKVLRENGFIEPADDDSHQLTDRGRAALDRWLATPPAPAQRRDEGMVKLMFADHAGPATMLALIRHRRAEATARRDVARATIPGAHWPPQAQRSSDDVLATWLVRAHTIALAEAELAWCDEAEATLAERGVHPEQSKGKNNAD